MRPIAGRSSAGRVSRPSACRCAADRAERSARPSTSASQLSWLSKNGIASASRIVQNASTQIASASRSSPRRSQPAPRTVTGTGALSLTRARIVIRALSARWPGYLIPSARLGRSNRRGARRAVAVRQTAHPNSPSTTARTAPMRTGLPPLQAGTANHSAIGATHATPTRGRASASATHSTAR